jgi:integrase
MLGGAFGCRDVVRDPSADRQGGAAAARERHGPHRATAEQCEDEEVRAMTREQLGVLLALIPTAHKLLCLLLASTGLRISEAVALQGQHLLNADNLRKRMLKPAAEEACLWSGFAFRAFRHTCATLLFGECRNAKQVQVWLGHHSAAFTLETYVHLLDGDIGAPLALKRPAVARGGR